MLHRESFVVFVDCADSSQVKSTAAGKRVHGPARRHGILRVETKKPPEGWASMPRNKAFHFAFSYEKAWNCAKLRCKKLGLGQVDENNPSFA